MTPGQISSWMQWMMLSFTPAPQVRIWEVHLSWSRLRTWSDHQDWGTERSLQRPGANPCQVIQQSLILHSCRRPFLLHRDVPFSALYLASYEMLKKEIPSRVNTSSSTCHIMAGLGQQFAVVIIKTRTRGLGVPIIFMSMMTLRIQMILQEPDSWPVWSHTQQMWWRLTCKWVCLEF